MTLTLTTEQSAKVIALITREINDLREYNMTEDKMQALVNAEILRLEAIIEVLAPGQRW